MSPRATEEQLFVGHRDDLAQQARREAKHFDDVYADADSRFQKNRYAVPQELVRQLESPENPPLLDREYAASVIGSFAGKKVLDYGAGDGWNTICLAKAKAQVWAIDISDVGIELTKKLAAANGVADRVVAEVQSCYNTRFEDDAFDVVFGGGIIHHLEVGEAAKELRRIMRPDGVGVFIEPIRESTLTDRVKAVVLFVMRRQAMEVTEDEDNLTMARIDELRRYFRVVRCQQFIVLSSANALIKSKALRRALMVADHHLIKWLPWFRKLGRSVVIEVREPIKGAH